MTLPAASKRSITAAVRSARRFAQDERAARADLSRTVEHVLVGEWDAVQRTAPTAMGDVEVRGFGRVASALGFHSDEGVDRLIVGLDRVEARFGSRERRDVAGPNHGRQCGEAQVGEVARHSAQFRVGIFGRIKTISGNAARIATARCPRRTSWAAPRSRHEVGARYFSVCVVRGSRAVHLPNSTAVKKS